MRPQGPTGGKEGLAVCPAGHKWATKINFSGNNAKLEQNRCPNCKAEAESFSFVDVDELIASNFAHAKMPEPKPVAPLPKGAAQASETVGNLPKAPGIPSTINLIVNIPWRFLIIVGAFVCFSAAASCTAAMLEFSVRMATMAE